MDHRIAIYLSEIKCYEDKIAIAKRNMTNQYLDQSYHDINIKIGNQQISYYTTLINQVQDKIDNINNIKI